jgi:hypothetical protein
VQGSVTAILIGLSILKYIPNQPDYNRKIGEAAYVQSGMNKTVDQASLALESKAKATVYRLGAPDRALAGILVTLKVVRGQEVRVNGPKVVSASTHFIAGLDHGILGITWRL